MLAGERVCLPEVGDEVGAHEGPETECVDRRSHSRNPEQNTNVRDDDGAGLVGRKHHSAGLEVCTREVRPASDSVLQIVRRDLATHGSCREDISPVRKR